MFSAFHPELAQAGIEANFERDGTEYRLGAERYTVADYSTTSRTAGFRNLDWREYRGDDRLVEEVPWAHKYMVVRFSCSCVRSAPSNVPEPPSGLLHAENPNG